MGRGPDLWFEVGWLFRCCALGGFGGLCVFIDYCIWNGRDMLAALLWLALMVLALVWGFGLGPGLGIVGCGWQVIGC